MRDLNDAAPRWPTSPDTLPLSDEVLMAWVDGELDASAHARVQAQLAGDPQARERVAQLQALTVQLRHAFAPELGDTVPAALQAAARGEGLQTAQVLTWPDARRTPPAPADRRAGWRGWARWGGLAASVVVALGVGAVLWQPQPGAETLLAQADGRLVARGALERSLQQSLASEPGHGPVRVLLSFKDHDGQFCRTFASPAGSGLACRRGADWQVAVLATPPSTAPSPSTGLRLASGDLPATVLEAVERRISGLTLDAPQERAARDGGWRP
ncbi:anti-sigma factor family protein [Roseateles sp. BYS87W]|uniref:Anti-sigma factor family protein n=1 Tax=Pelomonas baiyunensis TaxID=3299026 RepID=A0ABW7H2B7_9BURK